MRLHKTIGLVVLFALATFAAPRAQAQYIPGDAIHFVGDLGDADGSHHIFTTWVTKGWRVQDSGTVYWTGRYLLRQESGPGYDAFPYIISVPYCVPGGTVDIITSFEVPSVAGHFVAHYKMMIDIGTESIEAFPTQPGLSMDLWFDPPASGGGSGGGGS